MTIGNHRLTQPAIFLDRDGVIIENRKDYVLRWSDVSFYPQALTSLAKIKELAYQIVIITNQSAVGRGLMSLDEAQAINQRIVKEIEQAGGRINKVYICPHAPWENCDCRKPKPGLFLQAAEELSLDLHRSIMIGDALTDLVAAKAVDVGQIALVRTGRGVEQATLPEAALLQSFNLFDSLASALEDLLPSFDFPTQK